MPRHPTTRTRSLAIKRATLGKFTDTEALVARLINESTAPPCWRPVRAVAAMAAADPPPGHVWMTTEEFVTWLNQHFKPGRRTDGYTMEYAVGISAHRRRQLAAGAPVLKMEAMAMAHYAIFGRRLPISHQPSTEEFAAWTAANFGSVERIAMALGRKREYVATRVVGYALMGGGAGRTPRHADAGLIRAMDWMLRVGPFSPYGERPAPAYPGQGVAP